MIRRYRSVLLAIFGIAAVGAVGWLLARPAALPARRIVMATGPAGGGYAALGERYREELAHFGLDLILRPTQGDGENQALLQDPRSGVSVAFLQSGTTSERDSPGLESLGAMFVQPVWVFRHGARPAFGFGDLAGKTVSAGSEKSGTRAAIRRILSVAGVDPEAVKLVALPPERAAEALSRGEIDAMAIVSSWESPVVRRMVADPTLSVDAFPRADAFVALDPSLEKVILPQGVGDMAGNRPRQDVPLLAMKVSLVVPKGLHSAIQYLLLDAATDVHGRPGLFQKAGQFPAAEGVDLPLSGDARDFHKSGRPFLQRYMPYWMAVLVERLLLVLIPLLGVMFPLFRFLPELYNDVMEKRVVRLYGELKLLEDEVAKRVPGASCPDLIARLDLLEARVGKLHVPEKYWQKAYTLRQHIELVRGRLEGRGGRAPA